MGILPLVKGLPMRLTAAIDKKGGAYKNSQCILINWELEPAEEERIANLEDNEIVLMQQPQALHLKVLKATKHLHSDLGKSMLRLIPKIKIWSRDAKGHAKVRRKGFEVVPDFGKPMRIIMTRIYHRRTEIWECVRVPGCSCRPCIAPSRSLPVGVRSSTRFTRRYF